MVPTAAACPNIGHASFINLFCLIRKNPGEVALQVDLGALVHPQLSNLREPGQALKNVAVANHLLVLHQLFKEWPGWLRLSLQFRITTGSAQEQHPMTYLSTGERLKLNEYFGKMSRPAFPHSVQYMFSSQLGPSYLCLQDMQGSPLCFWCFKSVLFSSSLCMSDCSSVSISELVKTV